MGADEKHAATYHGGEYTPDTKEVEDSYTMDQVQISLRKSTVVAREEFRRWLETVRAEAKAEALRDAATELNRLDTDVEMYDENLRATQVEWWLRNRANQYKEN